MLFFDLVSQRRPERDSGSVLALSPFLAHLVISPPEGQAIAIGTKKLHASRESGLSLGKSDLMSLDWSPEFPFQST